MKDIDPILITGYAPDDRPRDTMATPSEAAVVTAIFNDPETATDVIKSLTPEDFSTPTLALTFGIIQRRHAAHLPVDPVSVATEYDKTHKQDGKLLRHKFAEILADVTAGLSPSSHLSDHVRALKRARAANELHRNTERLLQRHVSGEITADELSESTEKAASRYIQSARDDTDQWIQFVDANVITRAKEFTDHWIIPGLLPRGWIVLFGGEPKAGKTTTSRDLCFSVSHTGTFLLWPVAEHPEGRPWRSMYLDFDQPWHMSASLLEADAEARGINPDDLQSDACPVFYGTANRRDFCNSGHRRQVIDQIRANRIDLLVVDVFAKTFSDDLNEADSADMNKVHAAYAEIRNETGVTIVVLHHLRKPGREQGGTFRFDSTDVVNDFRGSTAITGNVDGMWAQRRNNNNVRFVVGPCRSTQVEQEIKYDLQMVPLDEEGRLFRIEATGVEDLNGRRVLTHLTAAGDVGASRQDLLDLFLCPAMQGWGRAEAEREGRNGEWREKDRELLSTLRHLKLRHVAVADEGRTKRYWLLMHAPEFAELRGRTVGAITKADRSMRDFFDAAAYGGVVAESGEELPADLDGEVECETLS